MDSLRPERARPPMTTMDDDVRGADHTAAATDPDLRREIVETVRRFVAREVTPVAAELEREDRFPAEIVEQMRGLGLFGVTIPEAYGGLGLDLFTDVGVIEELAYGWMSLTGIVNTHTMVATLLLHHGDDDQKQRWLPSLATGERRGALSLSEPDAGSDTRNIACRARLDGEEYVLNGTKAWVTNGERAALVALAARTDEGISAFVVEKQPGPASTPPSPTRSSGRPSGSRSGSTRRSSSSSPTWRPGSRRRGCSRGTPPSARPPACAATSRPEWRSCSPARPRWSWPLRPCASTAAWATRRISRSSGTTATPR